MRFLLGVAIFVSVNIPTIFAQAPNFSGYWTLDRDASDFTLPAFAGGRGGDAINRIFVTHAANGTLVIGTETNGLKAWSYIPGREVEIPVGRDTTMMATAHWKGNRIVTEGVRGDMSMREVMTLSADGERFTIEATTTTPEGTTINRLEYVKGRPVGTCRTWATPCKDFTSQQR